MKITEIRTFLVGRFLLVRVYTDEGIVGNGEAGLWAHHGVVKEALGELSDYYVGKDPLRIEHHYQVVSRSAHFMGAAMSAAMSAIDIALWDIFGKAVGLPVYQLLGGKCRDKVKVYENVGGQTPEEVRESAQARVEQGFTSFRMGPFVSGFEQRTSTANISTAVELVAAAREALGDEMDLGLEIHRKLAAGGGDCAGHGVGRLLRYCTTRTRCRRRALKPLSTSPRTSTSQIATGERCYNPFQFKDLIDRQIVSFIRPDLSLAGRIYAGEENCRAGGDGFRGGVPASDGQSHQQRGIRPASRGHSQLHAHRAQRSQRADDRDRR